jgi:hypothetical protein
MTKPPKKMLRDEAEMRAFYSSVGISPEIIELAIVARRNRPTGESNQQQPFKAKRGKGAAPAEEE